MYLLYIDESGQAAATKGSSTYFVLAGIALHEEDCYPFGRRLARIEAKVVGAANAGLELHASRIWSGRNEWSKVDQATRQAVVDAVFSHLARWKAPSGRVPRFFAVAIHKPSFRGRNVLELAHVELLKRFDSFISRLHVAGDSHRSLVIADDSSYEGLIQRLAPSWKRGSRIGPLHSLVEVPLYVDSKASYLVQAADFVAWSTWNYYERGHTKYIQLLNSRFDADAGIQHGVAHLIAGYQTCGCVPCKSKRDQTVTRTVPPTF